jgi:Flp pilus assembly protein TadD
LFAAGLMLAGAGCAVVQGIVQSREEPVLRDAIARLKKGDEAGATRLLDSLLNTKDVAPETYLLVAAACQDARRSDLSAGYAERGLQETPGAKADVHARLYSILGAARQDLGDFDRAIEAHKTALHLRPDEPALMNNLAYAMAEAPDQYGRLEQAEQLASRAVELAARQNAPPEELAMYQDTLGWAQFKLGWLNKALMNLTAASDALPSQPEILYHCAKVYASLGRIREARVILRRAVREDPSYTRAVVTLRELDAMRDDASGPAVPVIQRAKPR